MHSSKIVKYKLQARKRISQGSPPITGRITEDDGLKLALTAVTVATAVLTGAPELTPMGRLNHAIESDDFPPEGYVDASATSTDPLDLTFVPTKMIAMPHAPDIRIALEASRLASSSMHQNVSLPHAIIRAFSQADASEDGAKSFWEDDAKRHLRKISERESWRVLPKKQGRKLRKSKSRQRTGALRLKRTRTRTSRPNSRSSSSGNKKAERRSRKKRPNMQGGGGAAPMFFGQPQQAAEPAKASQHTTRLCTKQEWEAEQEKLREQQKEKAAQHIDVPKDSDDMNPSTEKVDDQLETGQKKEEEEEEKVDVPDAEEVEEEEEEEETESQPDEPEGGPTPQPQPPALPSSQTSETSGGSGSLRSTRSWLTLPEPVKDTEDRLKVRMADSINSYARDASFMSTLTEDERNAIIKRINNRQDSTGREIRSFFAKRFFLRDFNLEENGERLIADCLARVIVGDAIAVVALAPNELEKIGVPQRNLPKIQLAVEEQLSNAFPTTNTEEVEFEFFSMLASLKWGEFVSSDGTKSIFYDMLASADEKARAFARDIMKRVETLKGKSGQGPKLPDLFERSCQYEDAMSIGHKDAPLAVVPSGTFKFAHNKSLIKWFAFLEKQPTNLKASQTFTPISAVPPFLCEDAVFGRGSKLGSASVLPSLAGALRKQTGAQAFAGMQPEDLCSILKEHLHGIMTDAQAQTHELH